MFPLVLIYTSMAAMKLSPLQRNDLHSLSSVVTDLKIKEEKFLFLSLTKDSERTKYTLQIIPDGSMASAREDERNAGIYSFLSF